MPLTGNPKGRKLRKPIVAKPKGFLSELKDVIDPLMAGLPLGMAGKVIGGGFKGGKGGKLLLSARNKARQMLEMRKMGMGDVTIPVTETAPALRQALDAITDFRKANPELTARTQRSFKRSMVTRSTPPEIKKLLIKKPRATKTKVRTAKPSERLLP